jgi:hypothetical protein
VSEGLGWPYLRLIRNWVRGIGLEEWSLGSRTALVGWNGTSISGR